MKNNKLKTKLQFIFDAEAEELEFQDMTFESDLKNNIRDKTVKIIELKRKKIKVNDGSTRLF